MLSAAKEFYKNLKGNSKYDFVKNVTTYENSNNYICYEESDTYKIVEKSQNGIINGDYTYKFSLPDKGQHGSTSDTYTRDVSTGEIKLDAHSIMMVG